MLPGSESWDFVQLDPALGQLFVARRNLVQVVDFETGTVIAVIHGTRDARAIALDNHQEFICLSAGAFNAKSGFTERGRLTCRKAPLIYFELTI